MKEKNVAERACRQFNNGFLYDSLIDLLDRIHAVNCGAKPGAFGVVKRDGQWYALVESTRTPQGIQWMTIPLKFNLEGLTEALVECFFTESDRSAVGIVCSNAHIRLVRLENNKFVVSGL